MFGGGGHYPNKGAAKWVVSEKKGGPGRGKTSNTRGKVCYKGSGFGLQRSTLHDGFGGK